MLEEGLKTGGRPARLKGKEYGDEFKRRYFLDFVSHTKFSC